MRTHLLALARELRAAIDEVRRIRDRLGAPFAMRQLREASRLVAGARLALGPPPSKMGRTEAWRRILGVTSDAEAYELLRTATELRARRRSIDPWAPPEEPPPPSDAEAPPTCPHGVALGADTPAEMVCERCASAAEAP